MSPHSSLFLSCSCLLRPYKLTPATEVALQKLKIMTVTESLISNLNLQECSICQEEIETEQSIAEMPGCGHCFHNECVLKWFTLVSASLSVVFSLCFMFVLIASPRCPLILIFSCFHCFFHSKAGAPSAVPKSYQMMTKAVTVTVVEMSPCRFPLIKSTTPPPSLWMIILGG